MTASPAEAVACWYARADRFDAHTGTLCALLDGNEFERYRRFTHPAAQQAFLVAHAALRVLLAPLCASTPGHVALAFDEGGKPRVERGDVTFNLSHSGTLVAIAIGRGVQVGIDVEEMRPVPEHREIASQFFHTDEMRELASLREPEASQAFYRCWTRKESVAKALGLGLSLPLQAYRVACSPAQPARVLVSAPGMPRSAAWTLTDLPVGNRYAGAFAAPRAPLVLEHRVLDIPLLLSAAIDASALDEVAPIDASELARLIG